MRNLTLWIVLLAAGIAGFGFYRGWFGFTTNNADQKPSATFTIDKDKIQKDEQKAKDKVQGIGAKVKETTDELGSKSKERERQP